MNCLRAAVVIAVATLGPIDFAEACAVCGGEPGSPMVEGAKLGVIVLGTVAYILLTGAAFIGFTWVRRARRLDAEANISS